jgi:ubiquinol-cytochrome c reductase cytochrome b subunit
VSLGSWLDERTGYRRVVAGALEEPVAGGASWAYVFGSMLAIILVNQLVTGVLLALYYSPSAQTAWSSVAYVEDQVTMGWFIRGLHAHGASAMVIVAGLHMLQVAVYGAYRKPREVNWLVGALMLGLILAFALTGYLLPWDQKGYWATKVATGIMSETPLIGGWLQEVVQGGNEYGNLTLSRFFAIHVFLLPGALLTLLAIHLALFRKHGITPRWGRSPEVLAARTVPFWPDQLARDTVAVALAFAALVGITIAGHGVELGAPADPASSFDARPEWYFLPLFQILKYFHGAAERLVALGAPAVIFGFLFILPFIDRGPDRSPWRRLPKLVPLALLGAGAAALTFIALAADAGDAALQKRLVAADELAHKARGLALLGVPPGGGTAVYENEPHHRARLTFAERCAGCHLGKERKGPELAPGYNSRAWLSAYLVDPDGSRFFGVTKKIHKMKPTKYTGDDLDAVVEMLYAETGAPDARPDLVAKGQALFDNGPCSDCHSRDAGAAGDEGPNLFHRGTVDYLTEFIRDPKTVFGDKNEMPVFGTKLKPDEIAALAAYVASLREGASPAAASPPTPKTGP